MRIANCRTLNGELLQYSGLRIPEFQRGSHTNHYGVQVLLFFVLGTSTSTVTAVDSSLDHES